MEISILDENDQLFLLKDSKSDKLHSGGLGKGSKGKLLRFIKRS